MKKLFLSVIGMYIGILSSFSQNKIADSTLYKSRKLKLDEVNFVSGYYHQDGNNSAVTGGIGTERLTDIAGTVELKLSRYDKKYRKHNIAFEMGIDHYTSASSDKIDPYTISSASSADTRFYPSLSWNRQNEAKGTTIGANLSFSQEFDYTSFGAGVSFAKSSKDNNREFSARLQAYFDRWKVIYPIELQQQADNDGISNSQPRNSYSASLSYMQVVNKQLQVMLLADPTYQSGLLATKYQRVYFTDGSVAAENLPDRRFKLPLGLRANYFMGDKIIVRSFYRYYQDDWGLKAHTIELELPVKITPFISISPFYRFYSQNGINYFAPFKQHLVADKFFTSDYDLSKFNSHFFGAGFRIAPTNGVFGLAHWNSLELRYGHYIRNTGLNANQLSLNIKLKY